jgi:hypothetical protein
MALWDNLAMSYKHYTSEDDKTTVSFWIIAGSIIASVALQSVFFLLFGIVMCYLFLRTDSNMEQGKAYWEPGRFSRSLQDSADRLSRGRYDGSGYYSKKGRRRRNRYQNRM